MVLAQGVPRAISRKPGGRSGCILHTYHLVVPLYNLIMLYFIFVLKKITKNDVSFNIILLEKAISTRLVVETPVLLVPGGEELLQLE